MKYFNQILIGLITATASTLMFNDALGQSVGVAINDDNTAPYQDAILDMKHSTDPQLGVLFPRAANDWTPAAGARNGLIYYNTTDNEYRYWDNAGAGAWRTLLSVGATLPYIENQISTPQTPTSSPFSNFWISGEGKIGTNLTVGTESGTGSIILSDDDAWIGRSAATARIGFNSASGLIDLNSANVTIDEDKWLGISGADERIVFNGSAGEVHILGDGTGNYLTDVHVAIGTATPYNKAILDIASTTMGVIFPRLDNTAMGNINPGGGQNHGLWIYNTSLNKYMFWNGTAWVAVSSGSGNTLDRAYDEGGAGAGNFIDADVAANPVVINRTNGTYGLNVFNPSNAANDIVGIGFSVESSASKPRSAIIHERISSDGVGKLHLANSSDVTVGYEVALSDAKLTILSTGNVGIGETSPSLAKLQVKGSANLLVLQNAAAVTMATVENDGDMVIAGKFTSNGIKETSDGRFKKNVTGISNALSTILNLEGVTYNWRTEEFPERSFTTEMEYGVIAQQIEKFVPELVSTDENGYKSVQYSHMVPLLLEAIKEQQDIINSQSKELGVLKASVEAISEYIKTAEK